MFAGIENILGMNARNLLFIRPNNPRSSIRLADDKLATKKILKKNKIPTVPVLGVFEVFSDLEDFDWTSLPSNFVVKPTQGYGGEGIWVIIGLTKNGWKRSDGTIVGIKEIKDHVYDIFDGNYSLGNVPDAAYIEEKLKLHSRFKGITYGGGIPDIRVIVYNMVPVMAMLRLPTQESGGKANLHQGGIGVGIEIASGITTKAIWHGKIIKKYPGSREKLHGIKIPNWVEVLEMAAKCQKVTGLGYIGVDIVLDAKRGPVVLELNARPGLEIQNANLMPLFSRLRRVEGLQVKDPAKAVRVARELFGEEIGLEMGKEYGKPVLKAVENVTLIKGGNKIKIAAKVDTGAYRTSICRSIAEKLKVGKPIKKKYVQSSLGGEWREIYEIKMILSGKKFETQVFVADRESMRFDVIIGRRDLKNYLVDPSHKK